MDEESGVTRRKFLGLAILAPLATKLPLPELGTTATVAAAPTATAAGLGLGAAKRPLPTFVGVFRRLTASPIYDAGLESAEEGCAFFTLRGEEVEAAYAANPDAPVVNVMGRPVRIVGDPWQSAPNSATLHVVEIGTLKRGHREISLDEARMLPDE